MTITPTPADLVIGDSVALTATPRDSTGQPVSVQVTWSSSDTMLLAVSTTGMVVSKRSGTATVTAAAGGRQGQLTIPVRLAAASVVASERATCTVTTHGALACWGENWDGVFGTGDTLSSIMPTLGARGMEFRRIVLGSRHGCGLTATLIGMVCWGANDGGQLGRGTAGPGVFTRSPVSSGVAFDSMDAGGDRTCAIGASPILYCWGRVPTTTSTRPNPTQIPGNFVAVSTGSQHSCALTGAGAAWCWGSNSHGQLGDSTTTTSSVPVAVRGNLTFAALTTGLEHSCALTTSNDAWCWGFNVDGQVGDSTLFVDRLVPQRVAGGLKFRSISAGINLTCAVTLAGAAWCWGLGGLLGSGPGQPMESNVPVAVVGGHTFNQLSTGGSHACGLATDGRVYCWGLNAVGQAGQPASLSALLVPTAVVGQ